MVIFSISRAQEEKFVGYKWACKLDTRHGDADTQGQGFGVSHAVPLDGAGYVGTVAHGVASVRSGRSGSASGVDAGTGVASPLPLPTGPVQVEGGDAVGGAGGARREGVWGNVRARGAAGRLCSGRLAPALDHQRT